MALNSPSNDTVSALTAIFSSFPGMRLMSDRQRYLPMVADDLGVTLEIDQTGDRRLDVERMLRACAAHWGGVWALVEALSLFYEGPDLNRLTTQVAEHLAEPVLHASERAQLTRLLARWSLSPSWLRRAYRIAAPWAPPLSREPSSVLELAQELEELSTGPDGIPCLLTSIVAVTQETGDEGLARWFDEVAARHGLGPQQRAALRRGVHTHLGQRAVLIARLQPEPETDTVWLAVYLQWGSAHPDLQYADAAPRRLAEVPAVLDHLLHERDDLRGLDLMLEFVLPRGLLGAPVDEWEVGDRRYRLGHTYPVVVRPPDRHANVSGLPAWEARWRLVESGRAADPEAVYWNPQVTPTALRADLAGAPGRLCAVLPHPPEPAAEDDDCLGSALTAGLPAVVWCRSSRSPAVIETELVDACRTAPVREHPQTALDLRLRRGGEHLTLLWDDYDRRPPVDLELVLP